MRFIYKMRVLKPKSTLENPKGVDVEILFSYDNQKYTQLRICYLHRAVDKVKFGIYACSPIGSGFVAKISNFNTSVLPE